MDIQKEFLTPSQVQGMFGISRTTEIFWRKKGYLPKPLYLGGRVFYRASDLARLKNKVE